MHTHYTMIYIYIYSNVCMTHRKKICLLLFCLILQYIVYTKYIDEGWARYISYTHKYTDDDD